jgi:hypothetical protein
MSTQSDDDVNFSKQPANVASTPGETSTCNRAEMNAESAENTEKRMLGVLGVPDCAGMTR